MKRILLTLIALSLLFPLTTFIPAPLFDRPNSVVTLSDRTKPSSKKHVDTVLIIGSSIAAGWGDNNQGGYLIRAFRALTHSTNFTYRVLNWAIPGVTTTEVEKHYQSMLNKSHANIVVLSWGGLDDAVARTPTSVFVSHVQNEIKRALAGRSVVLIVTPPVTAATYLEGNAGLTQKYFHSEVKTLRQIANPNVYIFDVFDQMMSYLREHRQSYKAYMADGWHPNPRGHALAGQLLVQDMQNQFGNRSITWRSSVGSTK